MSSTKRWICNSHFAIKKRLSLGNYTSIVECVIRWNSCPRYYHLFTRLTKSESIWFWTFYLFFVCLFCYDCFLIIEAFFVICSQNHVICIESKKRIMHSNSSTNALLNYKAQNPSLFSMLQIESSLFLILTSR